MPYPNCDRTPVHSKQAAERRFSRGFSLVEIIVVVGIILLISAIALPSIAQSWNSYRLSGTAAGVSNILKRTRFEAIRRNTVVRCLIQQQGNSWLLGADIDNNGAIATTEPQVLLSGPIQLLPAGLAPGPSSMGYPAAQVPYGAGGQGFIAFDPRGGVNFGGGAQVVYVLYVGFQNQPRYGFRGITVLPLSNTKTWSSGSTGPWHSPIY